MGRDYEQKLKTVPDILSGAHVHLSKLKKHIKRDDQENPEHPFSVRCSAILYDAARELKKLSYDSQEDFSQIIEFLRRWERASLSMLSRFKPQEFSNSLYAHARLGIQPDPAWLEEWYQHSQEKLGEFNSQNFSNSLCAHALLGIKPDPAWLKEWCLQSKEKMGVFKPQDYANSIYALGLLAKLGMAEVPEYYMQTLLATPIPKEMRSDVRRLYQAYLGMRGLGMELHNPAYAPPKEEATVNGESTLEREFFSLLDPVALKAGCVTEREVWHPATASHIDAVISPPGSEGKLYLQLDGPRHYVRTPQGEEVEDGPTRFNTALLQESLSPGDVMLRIGYREFNANREQAVAKVMNALQQMSGHAAATPTTLIAEPDRAAERVVAPAAVRHGTKGDTHVGRAGVPCYAGSAVAGRQ